MKEETILTENEIYAKSRLPKCLIYAELLQEASIKFKLSINECRNKFGMYSIQEWENLLEN